jgi:hypothetical protein
MRHYKILIFNLVWSVIEMHLNQHVWCMISSAAFTLCMHHWVQRATRNAAGKCIAWVVSGMPIWVPLLQPRCIICNFYQGHQPCDPIRFPASPPPPRAGCITNARVSFSLSSPRAERIYTRAHTFIYTRTWHLLLGLWAHQLQLFTDYPSRIISSRLARDILRRRQRAGWLFIRKQKMR